MASLELNRSGVGPGIEGSKLKIQSLLAAEEPIGPL